MSYRSNVDEQVVKMSFDNSNFDSNVNDSIKTLNSLDSKLSSLNNANFSGLNSGMESLSNFLTVKGQVMFGVLTRLGSEVVNFGIKAKNALFKGVKDGVGEYETIINSTQTIFQNVKQHGSTLDDVNNALDELNKYADLTIYNFGQMTNMIGKFTSAGVGLKKSVSTIKGLANAAALVGATPEKAEQAWQAVARSMSRGTFNLLTWKSLQNSTIAGEQFTNVIKEVARANNAVGKSGKNIDQMLEQYGSLEYTLSENWLTGDLFNEAMAILSGDLDEMALEQKGYTQDQIKALLEIADSAKKAATQVKTFKQLMDTLGEAIGSGWAQSFRILIGDLDQAKVLYTRISEVVSGFIDNNAKIRNSLFKQIMDENNTMSFDEIKTGRENFKQIIENMMATIKTFLKAVKTGFLNIFPIERISASARKVLDVVQKFTRAFVLNSKEAKQEVEGITGWDTSTIDRISDSVKDLIRFFRGLASAIDVVWMVISQPIKAIIKRVPFLNNFFDKLGSGVQGLVKNLGNFGDKITVFRNALKDTNLIEKAVGYFIDNIDALGERFPILGSILWVFKSIKSVLSGIKNGFKSLNIKPLATIFGAIKFVAEIIWKVLNFVFGIFKYIKNSIDWSFLDGPKNAIIGFLKKLSDYGQGLISFEELTGKIGEKISKVFSNIIGLFNKSGSSNKFADDANKSFSKLGDTVAKTGNKVQTVWDKVKSFFSGIGTFFKNMFANADWSLEGIAKKIGLIGGGVAAAALAIGHLKKTLAKIAILENLSDLLKAGTNVLKAYQREMSSKAILNIAISVGILAAAMMAMAFVPYDKLENGLVIFSSFMATLAVTLTPIITALAKFNESIGKARKQLTQFDVLDNLVTQLGKIGKKLARGFEFRMIGKMFKDVSISIFIFVGAIAALVLLIKLDGDTVKEALKIIITLIITLTVSIAALVFIMEKTAKVSKNTNTIIGTFSSFFKLSGVAKVILAIAAAVLVLVIAIGKMVKMDSEKMRESWAYIMGLVGLLGAIAVGVAYFTSKAKDLGKLKKITVSLAGALVGVAIVLLAMKPLIEAMNSGDENAWLKAIAIFTAIIGQFTAMAVVLLLVANKISGKKTLWEQLDKTILAMTGIILSIAVVIYAISKLGDISWQTVAVIGIISLVLLGVISLLALIAIVTSKAKGTFSTNFANIIYKVSISIAAVIAAIGVMAAGIAALVAALSSMNISDSGIDKASSNILDKLGMIADTIEKALPKLKSMFFRIGISVGSVMISFLSGIITSFVTNGGEILEIADKFVNIILDIIDKVVEILYSRKDDIARIIKRVLEFLFAEITAVLNSFFKKKDGTGLFTENGVAKLLGIIGGGIGILKIAKYFNTLTGSVKKLGTALKGLGMNWSGYKTIGENLSSNNAILLNKISNLKLIKSFGNSVAGGLSKITGKDIEYDSQTPQTPAQTLAALGAIIVAVKAVEVANHGIKQLLGEELPYVRTDVIKDNTFKSWMASLGALFTDKMFLMQVAVEGMSKLGEIIVVVLQTIFSVVSYAVISILEPLFRIVQWIGNFLWDAVETYYRTFGISYKGYSGDEMANMVHNAKEEFNNFFDGIFGTAGDPFDNGFKGYLLNDVIGGSWQRLFQDTEYTEFIGPEAKENAYNDGYDVGKNITAGASDGLSKFGSVISNQLTSGSEYAIESLRVSLGIASPSKVTEEIYKNVMMGCIKGLKESEHSFYDYCKHVTDTSTQILTGDIEVIKSAWAEIANAMGYSSEMNEVRKATLEITDYSNPELVKTVDLNRQYLDILFEEADAIKGLGRDEAARYLASTAYTKGLAYSVSEAMDIIDAVFSEQEDKTKITMAGIQAFNEDTILSISDVLGKAATAQYIAMEEIMTNYSEMLAIANDHKEEMIGMKKEEVEEFLKQEGIERGLSTQAAADQARIITEKMFEGAEERHKITRSELESKLGAYQADSDAYWELEKQKVLFAQKSAELRAKLEKQSADGSVEASNEYLRRMQEVKNENDMKALMAWTQTAEGSKSYKEFKEVSDELAKIKNDERALREDLLGQVKDLYTGAGIGENEYEDYFSQYYQKAMNTINKNESNKRGSFKTAVNSFLSMLGISTAKDPELKWWDYNEEAKESSTLTDSEVNSAISAASDLKDGLESQRADLTPTFDLDRLAEDAQKANGIVMSSLMAAQNASIGDYINQDSELNPFMKDRWQNVYNFTQNNYSPKALSRIDIYRQTQRQLGMSRGF